jgi:hypothetical protein
MTKAQLSEAISIASLVFAWAKTLPEDHTEDIKTIEAYLHELNYLAKYAK